MRITKSIIIYLEAPSESLNPGCGGQRSCTTTLWDIKTSGEISGHSIRTSCSHWEVQRPCYLPSSLESSETSLKTFCLLNNTWNPLHHLYFPSTSDVSSRTKLMANRDLDPSQRPLTFASSTSSPSQKTPRISFHNSIWISRMLWWALTICSETH